MLLAEERGSERLFAVKVLKKDVLFQDEDTESAMVEKRVLALASRPHFLTALYCAFQTEVRAYRRSSVRHGDGSCVRPHGAMQSLDEGII